MDKTDLDFVHEMVAHLDRTIQQLTITEKEISIKIGALRVEELTEYWLQELEAGSRYFCESLFWASQPKQAAKT